jgi:MoxR-like ATPase
MTDELVTRIEALGDRLAAAKAMIDKRFIGQEKVVDLVLASILCGGHALLVGLPGLGKTRLVDTLSTVLGLHGNRIQFTPDLMPADILGSEVLETAADGSPRTQSALLQAMQEREVTIAGQHRPLGRPFHVLATQNPIEQEGTYPLPEAQLDRFLLQIDVAYPVRQAERDILLATTGATEAAVHPVFTAEELLGAQEVIRRMPVGDSVVEAILDLVRGCRPGEPEGAALAGTLAWGPGPRAAQALMLAVRARALLEGRLAPSVADVAALAQPVLVHRMALTFAARARGESLSEVIAAATARSLGLEAAA